MSRTTPEIVNDFFFAWVGQATAKEIQTGDEERPRCKHCERLGEKCRRSEGRLKYRDGSSHRYDKAFPTEQTWVELSRSEDRQFIDEGPDLRNWYARDDLDEKGAFYGDSPDRIDTAIPSLIEPPRQVQPNRSPSRDFRAALDNHTKSPPTQPGSWKPSHISSAPPTSPPKRRKTDDYTSPTSSPWSGPGTSTSSTIYDPVRFRYLVHDSPKGLFPQHDDTVGPVPESVYIRREVEAEFRRLADSEAARVPKPELLSPKYWREHFLWPNKDTTVQCEALMMYYVVNLGPIFDAGDPARHFTLTVPQRARRCPPLLNAIFTAASRHLFGQEKYKTRNGIVYQRILLPKLTLDTALYYHNACIAYLKELSNDSEWVGDENLLAAAVILRYYEELDSLAVGEDKEIFLTSFNLFFKANKAPVTPPKWLSSPLATPANDPMTKSCREYLKTYQHAATRVALRQEITTAFLRQRPVRLPLTNWSFVCGYDEVEDFIWSDRHLLHLANVLQFCFAQEELTGRSNIAMWNELKLHEQQWEENKPISFSPIHYQEAGTGSGCLPHAWHLAETHVNGIQYLNLARILLTVYDPNVPRLGPGVTLARRHMNEQVRATVLEICGLAVSNPENQPAMIPACMAVAVSGESFTNRDEQNTMLDILKRVEMEQGWPTARIITDLKQAWDGQK